MKGFIFPQADWYSNFHLKQITKTNAFSGISCQEVTVTQTFLLGEKKAYW